nr:hypothetical protein CK203_077047 [Ipomoea batatas]
MHAVNLRVELVGLGLYYDLSQPSNGCYNHQKNSKYDADPVSYPRKTEFLGFVDCKPHNTGQEVCGWGESETSKESKKPSKEREGNGNKHCECHIDVPSEKAQVPSWPEHQFLNKHRLDHVKHRHCINLITSDDMNNYKHVGHGNEPSRVFQGDKNVILHGIPKHPIPNKGNREITQSNHNISHNNPSPHRSFRRPLRGRRNSSLNLQHHIMPSIGKRHIP